MAVRSAAAESAAVSPEVATAGKPARDDRPVARGERTAAGTSGGSSGTSGSRLPPPPAGAVLAFLCAGIATTAVNAISQLDDAARSGDRLASWAPWLTEGSSFVGWTATLPLILQVWRRVRAAGSPWRVAGWLAAGALACSAVHVAVMVLLRLLLWPALSGGDAYQFGGAGSFVYELRKDVLTFLGFSAMLWAETRLRRGTPEARPAPAETEAALAPPSGVAPVVLSDGERAVQVWAEDLLAVHSSGNYITLLRKDGRRPLLRTTLAAAESALGSAGFVRTHRSWLVRTSAVTRLDPTGAGDWRAQLGENVTAPVSRRYAAALRTRS